MYLNNINFPNQILDAIRANRLVIFAGAGASVEKPTSLPNFLNLTKEIAEDTGKTIHKEPCEVFLGTLKDRGIDVNTIAANILSHDCLKHNLLHEAIVNVFPSADKVKIVTTNYDQMFEQVFEEMEVDVPVFNAPALPLGNDINGIVHIHGNVSDPQYMVLTDDDFGRAYLTEGYATRFLVKLFESYTVLFIGYSYNDTILRYLTRAMYRGHSANRYILTTDMKSNWMSLGITAISFPKRSYAVMRGGLVKLGNYAKKGLRDWQDQFLEIEDEPPKDMTIETEIDYCLENIDCSRVMAKCVHGAGWLNLLDKKDVFSCCFSDLKPITESNRIWANWLCDRFVGCDDQSLITFFAKYRNSFSDFFAEMILRKIVRDESHVSDEYIKKYITLLDKYLVDQWILSSLIEIVFDRKMYHLSLHLFERLFVPSIQLEKSVWISGESLEPRHLLIGDYHTVNNAWNLIKDEAVLLFAPEILSFVQKTIEEVHYQYVEMDAASENAEPWSMSMLVVEDRVKEYSKEPFHILVQAFLQAIKKLGENEGTKQYLNIGLNSDSILLRKIILRAIRESKSFSNDQKIDLICNNELVWFVEGKEQVFLLARDAFVKASYKKQNRLLDIIELGPTDYEDKRIRQYAVYNWCVWLQKVDPANERLELIIRNILSENDFTPRMHPERNIEESNSVYIPDESSFSIEEMLNMPFGQLTTLLVGFEDNTFDGPTRRDLLNTFTNCVKGNTQWASDVMDYFYLKNVNDVEIWNSLIGGVKAANQTIDEAFSWCEKLARIVDKIPDMYQVAYYLWKVLQHEGIQKNFEEKEQELFELSLELWNRRCTTTTAHLPMKTIDKTLNTTTGIVLMCWLHMASYSNNTELPEIYKKRFEEALHLNSWEREVATCILAGHFNFLCYRDRAWCVNLFEPMLTGKRKKIYISAWEGIVFFSRRINKDTADIMAPIYLKAVKNINWLEGDVRDGFIELYLTLLIFVVEKPTVKYIPELYKVSSEEMRCRFVAHIKHRLRNMEEEIKKEWWNNWLKRFIENRKSNKPVELTDSECEALFMMLPHLDFEIDDAVKILCTGSMPSKMDRLFWYELDQVGFATTHPQSIAKLLTTLLNSIKEIGIGKDYAVRIAKGIQGIKEKEQKQLQEAFLKHGIHIVLN